MRPEPGLETTHLEVEISGEVRRFPLDDGSSWSIGRDARNAIVLASDPMASRKHALVQREASGNFYLSDLGSRNGTTVNGLPITNPVRLHHGDAFTIGSHEFLFHDPAPPARDATALPQAATALQVVRRMLTILVVDIRNYTGISRALGEAGVSELMNEFFSSAGAMLRENGSWSQKYIGDAVMAAWVHDEEEATPRELVLMLESVVALSRLIDGLNSRYDLPEPLLFGAGVNSGFAVTGNMGSSALADHTAMGDTVNKAFRLESASKEIGRDLVFGRDAFELLAVPETARPLFTMHTVHLKGYDEPEEVFGLDLDGLPRLIHALG